MLKHVNSNLIEMALNSEFDVIVHGCNCFHTMGAGIAFEIKRNFPEAYKLDTTTPRGDKTKLGKTSSAFCKNNIILKRL